MNKRMNGIAAAAAVIIMLSTTAAAIDPIGPADLGGIGGIGDFGGGMSGSGVYSGDMMPRAGETGTATADAPGGTTETPDDATADMTTPAKPTAPAKPTTPAKPTAPAKPTKDADEKPGTPSTDENGMIDKDDSESKKVGVWTVIGCIAAAAVAIGVIACVCMVMKRRKH